MLGRRLYVNPPVVEVVYLVRLTEPWKCTSDEAENLFDLVRETYDGLPFIEGGDYRRLLRTKNSDPRFCRFRTKDGSRWFQVGGIDIQIGTTPPYDDWEKFENRIAIVIDAIERVHTGLKADRLSLDYTNQLILGREEPEQDYIGIWPGPLDGFPNEKSTQYTDVRHERDDGSASSLIFASPASREHEKLVTFKIAEGIGRLDRPLTETLESARECHDRINSRFEKLITDRARLRFGKEGDL